MRKEGRLHSSSLLEVIELRELIANMATMNYLYRRGRGENLV